MSDYLELFVVAVLVIKPIHLLAALPRRRRRREAVQRYHRSLT